MRSSSVVRAAGRAVGLGLAVAVLGCAPRASSDAARTLQVLVTEIPTRLDPYEDQRLTSVQIFANVYEPLVRMEAGNLVPVLAETWQNPTPELNLFRLRPDRRFHDGARLDSQALVESLERARSSSENSGHFAEVAAIREVDPLTVSVRTRAPVAVLVYGLTGVMITRPGGLGFVGTGPYRVAAFQPGEAVRLVRAGDGRRPAPYLDEIVFRRYEGDAQALRLIRAQPTTLLAPAPPAVAAWARSDRRLRVVTRPTTIVHYLAFGFTHAASPPLRDVRVRRAIRLALDLPGLAAASPAGGQAASQLVPPGTVGFDPALAVPRRDLPAARALLAAAGFAGGVDVDLDVRGKNEELARAVAAQLAEADVRVSVRVRPVEEFAERIDGNSPFFLYNWVVGQEAGSALRNFFHTRDRVRALGLQNRTAYSNAALDALLERAAQPLAPGDRVALQRQAMTLLMHELPWIPLLIPNELTVQPASLEFPARLDEMLPLSDVRPVAPSPEPR